MSCIRTEAMDLSIARKRWEHICEKPRVPDAVVALLFRVYIFLMLKMNFPNTLYFFLRRVVL